MLKSKDISQSGLDPTKIILPKMSTLHREQTYCVIEKRRQSSSPSFTLEHRKPRQLQQEIHSRTREGTTHFWMHGIPYPNEYSRIPKDKTWYPVSL